MSYLEVKHYIPAQPHPTHPPQHEPIKILQPTDPFHNAFYYTNDEQNNILGQRVPVDQVVNPVRYVRRRRHEFIPIEDLVDEEE